MTKRFVDVDDLLIAAQGASGGAMIKLTVHRSLELLVAQHRRKEAELRDRWIDLGDSLADLQDQDVMRRAWS
ncbi:MAG: hypothetical protein ACRDRH_27090 [Pseudonocardia sp.]